MQNKHDLWYLIVPISIFTIAITGYYFAEGDHAFYIPVIRRILDPSLYPGDYFFQQPLGKSSLLWPIVAYLSKVFSLEWVFFIGYIAAIVGLFWAVYRLAFSLFGNRDIAWIALLLLCISRRQDDAIVTQETLFAIQPIAMPFCIMTLCFFVEERYILAAVFNALAFLLHPIAAMPVLLLLGLYLLFNIRYLGWKMVLKAFGAFLLITSPLLIIAAVSKGDGVSGSDLFKIASKEWMNIQYRRSPFTFPALWGRASWEHFLSIAALLVASMSLKIMYAGIDKKDQRSLWIV